MKERVRETVVDPVVDFLRAEATGGLVLLVAAVAALAWANLAGEGYTSFWERELGPLDLHHWVNDALMSLFFFVVGLEIKRELVRGELRDPRAAALPAIAAVGGIALPVLIYVALTTGGEGAKGWAIPAATDIAFAVGVLTVLGDRISSGLRLFLLTIAIVDDIIAIAIIALFYGGGVHPTIVAVALGLLTPARPVRGRDVLGALEHRLHPVSAFVVVPVFALANAGVDLGDGALGDALGSTVTWAIVAGLVAGKLIGIGGATIGALRMGIGALPAGAPAIQVPGIAALGGIGFTVSLFIAELAFEDDGALNDTAKVGILLGSAASAALGLALLLALGRRA